MWLWRKLTTRPLWWWQRHRPYPVRSRIWHWRAQRWNDSSGAAVAVLTTPRTLANAVWTAYSFGRRLADRAGLSLVLDGAWNDADRARVRSILPDAVLRETRDEVKSLGHACPALQAFAAAHPLGRKLAATLMAQKRGNVLFADDDLLAFGTLSELRDDLAGGVPVNRYLQEQGARMQEEPAIMDAARRLGLAWLTDLNDGLLLLRKDSLDCAMAERLVTAANSAPTWFTGTVVMSVLLAAAGSRKLPPCYLVSTAGQFYWERRDDLTDVQLRHYVGPVRHLMYAEGMPKVLGLIAGQDRGTQ